MKRSTRSPKSSKLPRSRSDSPSNRSNGRVWPPRPGIRPTRSCSCHSASSSSRPRRCSWRSSSGSASTCEVREIGLLLAVGLQPKTVRRLFLVEGLLTAVIGSLLGMVAGVGYARLMLAGLQSWWLDAIVTPFLTLHVTALSLVIRISRRTVPGARGDPSSPSGTRARNRPERSLPDGWNTLPHALTSGRRTRLVGWAVVGGAHPAGPVRRAGRGGDSRRTLLRYRRTVPRRGVDSVLVLVAKQFQGHRADGSGRAALDVGRAERDTASLAERPVRGADREHLLLDPLRQRVSDRPGRQASYARQRRRRFRAHCRDGPAGLLRS